MCYRSAFFPIDRSLGRHYVWHSDDMKTPNLLRFFSLKRCLTNTPRRHSLDPSGRLDPWSSWEFRLLLKPWLFLIYAFRRGGVGFRQATVIPTSLAGPVSIGASIHAVESSLGSVPAPFACNLPRFGLSFSSCLALFSLKLGVLVLYLTLVVAHLVRHFSGGG